MRLYMHAAPLMSHCCWHLQHYTPAQQTSFVQINALCMLSDCFAAFCITQARNTENAQTLMMLR